MAKFRKRPLVIEAVQWTGANEAEMNAFLGREYSNHGGLLRIRTPEGVMEAAASAWVIKGVMGEFYPCQDDVFQATYESADVCAGEGAGVTVGETGISVRVETD